MACGLTASIVSGDGQTIEVKMDVVTPSPCGRGNIAAVLDRRPRIDMPVRRTAFQGR